MSVGKVHNTVQDCLFKDIELNNLQLLLQALRMYLDQIFVYISFYLMKAEYYKLIS